MPSVASDPSVISSFQPLPPARLPSASDNPEGATPFAMLLDSASQTAEPPPAPAPRSERPERSERTEAKPDRSDDAPPADERRTDAPGSSTDAKTCKDKDNKESKEAEQKAEAGSDPTADASAKAGTTVDAAAAAILVSSDALASTPAGTPTAVALPTTAEVAVPTPDTATPVVTTPDIEAPSPVQAAAAPAPVETVEAPAAAKPEAEGKGPAKGAPASTTSAAPTTTQDTPAVKPVEAGQDDGSQPRDEHATKHADPVADEPKQSKPEPTAARPPDAPAVKSSFEVLQNLGLSAPSSHAAPTAFAHAAPALAAAAAAPEAAVPIAQAVPMAGVAVEIATQVQAGKNRFEIRLDPPELGRIDVRLDVDREGHVTSRLVVDRVETLDLLRRDAAQLERALQQAGLKTADNALQFSLRDQSLARDDRAPEHATRLVVPDDDAAPLQVMRRGTGIRGLGGGIDIRV